MPPSLINYLLKVNIRRFSSKIDAVSIPPRYNFVRDHLEVLAGKERKSGRKKLAYWWIDSAGHEVKFSFSELVDRSKVLATGLLNKGLSPGDRVLLLLPRVPEWWLFLLACFRSGIVPIPATIMLSENDISYRLKAARPKMVVTVPEIVSKVDKALTSFVQINKVVCPQPTTSNGQIFSQWIKFDDLLRNASSEHTCIDNATDDSMMCYFTSGTTGPPKMVDLTHGFALGHLFSTTPFIGSKPGQVTWIYADPGWVATLYGAVFPPWYLRNAVFSYYQSPSTTTWPSRIFEVLRQYPINVFITAPTAYRMLLQEKHLPTRAEMPHLVDCLSGGEALNAETWLAWRQKIGFEIRELYGQTETPGLIGNMPGCPMKPGSFGKKIGFDIRVATGEEGHIAVKYGQLRPFLFKQYFGDQEATTKAFRGDGYYLTGDRARGDADGYLYFSCRSDDVILSSGYRIGPFEVESALLEHPAVLESAAIASPCRERGEVVKAFIVLKDAFKDFPDKTKLAAEIQAVARQVTAPYKCPRRIEFVDQLPKTISGKIKHAELRRKEWADQLF